MLLDFSCASFQATCGLFLKCGEQLVHSKRPSLSHHVINYHLQVPRLYLWGFENVPACLVISLSAAARGLSTVNFPNSDCAFVVCNQMLA